MAYMNQERKSKLAPKIKAVLKKYNMKGTIAVKHHSALVVNLKSGPIDFWADCENGSIPGNHFKVNEYWYKDYYSGKSLEFLSELIPAMNGKGTDCENYDKSDIQSDYFNVGWYIDINVGDWQKPYKVTA